MSEKYRVQVDVSTEEEASEIAEHLEGEYGENIQVYIIPLETDEYN